VKWKETKRKKVAIECGMKTKNWRVRVVKKKAMKRENEEERREGSFGEKEKEWR
jgi:hypothetical protein